MSAIRGAALAVCAAACLLGAAPAQGAPGDPLFVFVPAPPPPPVFGSAPPPVPPPTGYLNGPCGLAVDPSGRFYVSDYYHHAIHVYSASADYVAPPPVDGGTGYAGQIANVDPLGGPCGLAFDGSGIIHINNYHRNVQRSGPGGPVIDSSSPTGVAADTNLGRIYVNNRTHVSAYDSSGAPVLDGGGEPLRIGQGTLGDGYGLAVSAFAGTMGRLYVPDAATDTVKVYDPALDPLNPIAEIKNPFGKPFISLRDSAIAVDRATGEIYFAEDTQPQHTEKPQAIIYVYNATNTFKGRLKYKVITARPPGLAVDNSAGATQGRVYVTSGNTHQAGIYAYPPASAIGGDPLPPSFSLAVASRGTGGGQITSDLGAIRCTSVCEEEIRSGASVTLTATPQQGSAFSGWSGGGCEGTGTCTVQMSRAREVGASFVLTAGPPAPSFTPAKATASEIAQKGNLRLTVEGNLSPRRLPRKGVAPIAVSIGGEISTTDGALPPRLKKMRIELNRHGRLDYRGLPTCDYSRIQPGSTGRALAGCRSSLVGRGRFSAIITLAGQEPYETEGRLLVFNSTRKGKPVLYGHIYSPRPFATSFVIVFEIGKLRGKTYGTALSATPPPAFKRWGNLTGLEMTLQRRYFYEGKRHSYISAGCPAPKGFPGALFALARTTFDFTGGQKLTSVLTEDCKVRG
jgi:List-Bact-rpt repeat protein/NHL repeat-containing protein